jgi:hypothetical protein
VLFRKLQEQGKLVFYDSLKVLELSSGAADGGPLASDGANREEASLRRLHAEVVTGLAGWLVLDSLLVLPCLGHSVRAAAAFLHNLRLSQQAAGRTAPEPSVGAAPRSRPGVHGWRQFIFK